MHETLCYSFNSYVHHNNQQIEYILSYDICTPCLALLSRDQNLGRELSLSFDLSLSLDLSLSIDLRLSLALARLKPV